MPIVTLDQLVSTQYQLSLRPLDDEVANVCLTILAKEIKARQRAGRPKSGMTHREQNRAAQRRYRERLRLKKMAQVAR